MQIPINKHVISDIPLSGPKVRLNRTVVCYVQRDSI